MLLSLGPFKGTAPRFAPHLLPDNAAQTAQNCRLLSGALESWKNTLFEATPSKIGTKLSIWKYPYSGSWFHWTTDVDVVRAQVAGDTYQRVYFTGDGAPKMTASDIYNAGGGTNYPTDSLLLGLPAPTVTPVATPVAISAYSAAATYAVNDLVTETGLTYLCLTAITTPEAFNADKWLELNVTDLESRTYVITFLTSYGEEGPPSSPSAIINVYPHQRANLATLGTGAPVGDYAITKKRIYRTNTGTTTTDYQFVAEIDVTTTTYSDTKKNDELGDVLLTTDWDAPPSDLKGLIALPNGSFAAFRDKEVWVSVPYQPHAWRVSDRVIVEYPVVAIDAIGTSIIVTTTGAPYLITGSTPGAMTPYKLESGFACTSKRGLVDMGDVAVYPSPIGLMGSSTSGMKVLTEEVMTKDEWSNYTPSSITAFHYVGNYIGFYDTGSVQAGFIFNPTTGDFTDLDFYATAGYYEAATGKLYLQVGNDIVQFDAGASKLTYTWKSKEFLMPPVNFAYGKVRAVTYPVTAKVYADGVLKHTETVVNEKPFPLPSGFLAEKWEVVMTGTARVKAAFLATSMEELQQV